MKIDHVHFYVEDARALRHWFVNRLGFQAIASKIEGSHTLTEAIACGSVRFILSSPLTSLSPVAKFLQQHPPGVADIAFAVEDVAALMARAIAAGAKVIKPIEQYQSDQECYKWGKIAAWGALSHTLIERQDAGDQNSSSPLTAAVFTGIDHVVLNVAAGDLERAVSWYQAALGFQAQQKFKIHTSRSALHSQVMVSPNSCVQLPINQPATPNSQIQEFLDVNRGPGIQHIALQTRDIVTAIAQFRDQGVSFLPVPLTYYTQLQQRCGLPLTPTELVEIAQQQILVDWQADDSLAVLLQTFTQPIFSQPTFFFELIERRSQARGFGEGNFRALFEAIEREQVKRGSLPDC